MDDQDHARLPSLRVCTRRDGDYLNKDDLMAWLNALIEVGKSDDGMPGVMLRNGGATVRRILEDQLSGDTDDNK